VLSPGVTIHEGAIVRDSIIMTDAVIGPNAVIDHCIIDKHVVVGAGSRLGVGEDYAPNWLEPSRINTGLTIVGRNARIPAKTTAGRNVLVGADVKESDFESLEITSGETVDPRVPIWA
jgi:glucose-1-phosphate adenylyltransferase